MAQTPSRRDFIKGTAMAAAGLAASGALAGSAFAAGSTDASASSSASVSTSSSASGSTSSSASSAASANASAASASASSTSATSGVDPYLARTAYTTLNPQDYDYMSNSITDFTKTKLFSEWQFGPLTLHHRIVKTAAFQLAFLNGNPDEYISYYENFAKGGVEMIWVENFANLWEFCASPMKQDFSAYDVAGLLDAIHSNGAYAGYQMDTMGSAIGPLQFTTPFLGDYTVDDIHAWEQAIIDAAKTLHDAGFDAFELNSAANNVGQSFLSRARNNRTDDYGPQTIESRTLFAREIIAGIKEACGADWPVQILINAIEANDQTLGDDDAYNSVEEVCAIAQALEAAGADSLHVRLGPCGQHIAQFANDLYFETYGMEGNNGFGGQFDFARHFEGLLDASHSGCGMLLDVAKRIKDSVSIPVGAATYMDPAHAPDLFEKALQDEKVDFLMVNRPICVDPEYVNKLRDGRIDEIAPCTRCLHCFYDPDKAGKTMEHCRVNTCIRRAYNEQMPEGYDPLPADGDKKVMIIGAGPAGMEAARISAQRGYTTTIYEKNSTVGGLLPFANAIKGPHENLTQLTAYLKRELEVNGATLVTDQEVDADFIKQEAPDVVIVATGGQRAASTLTATAGTSVMSITDFPYNDMGDEVTVLGSNCQAADLSVYLTSMGKHVTIVTPDTIDLFEKGHSVNVRDFIKSGLTAHGTRIWPAASVKTVGDGEITITNQVGLDVTFPCDAVVDASDMVADTSLTDAISGGSMTVYAIGDCNDPYNIAEAITAGNLTARAI